MSKKKGKGKAKKKSKAKKSSDAEVDPNDSECSVSVPDDGTYILKTYRRKCEGITCINYKKQGSKENFKMLCMIKDSSFDDDDLQREQVDEKEELSNLYISVLLSRIKEMKTVDKKDRQGMCKNPAPQLAHDM